MKIQSVTIEGYQSHKDSTFHLSPGLTVITGPSDAGKTAIIRALRWLAFNEPQGEAFLHTIRNPDGSVKEAVDQARVSVTFDDGTTITKTRRKGKTSYTHSAFPTGWEKAEVPPEIKETLGLLKQGYGDFETCLNFAFQLDPPFLLSETASVGAKVLGKLAGTEVVDKSISEVNKKTVRTRTDISYADKQIGEIDVSLIEYFDLDDKDRQLTAAEEAYARLIEDRDKRSELLKLETEHEAAVDSRIKFFDKVESLSFVVTGKPLLSKVVRDYQKVEVFDMLARNFWKAVHDQDAPLKVISRTRGLEVCKEDLEEVERKFQEHETLYKLATIYRYEQGQAEKYKSSIDGLYFIPDAKKLLFDTEQANTKLEALKRLRNTSSVAYNGAKYAQGKVDRLKDISDVWPKYEAVQDCNERLTLLKAVKSRYLQAEVDVLHCDKEVTVKNASVDAFRSDLAMAWEEAGGVCPLCGSEVKQ